MRIQVWHDTTYNYSWPVTGVIQILRLTPRNSEGQYVLGWRIDVSADCPVSCHVDAFGNVTHTLTADGPLSQLVVHVEGEAEVEDTNGVVKGTIEPFPPSLFLRETPLTQASEEIRVFANNIAGSAGKDRLTQLHALLDTLPQTITFDTDPTHVHTTAAEAFALKRGVCQDISHIFIAAARSLGIPARYVSGYFYRADGMNDQHAGHAWAEAYVDGLGWVGFDATNGMCPTDSYLRVASGLDYLNAAPVRGSRIGGEGEGLDVRVRVQQGLTQRQE
ncbi:transglutaminase family protein [Pseudorhodoplanes sp.]|uniref:transglutaminase family protein n=1 Tax=Pseudorhodoplanes sp. TaxID=1934341 RepID=UPI002BBD6892|nr:transglutaminase family protein [Pseudorhodoplanes sp.]HWV51875.1 transglutaminase family protein [Pseudorhodoplanes sp.]